MNAKSLFLAAMVVTVAVLALGCASTKETESMLSAAGFKTMPATTPEQQAHLKSLPPQKVTMVAREGRTYFVYPDRKEQALYVGTQVQYDEYQRLRREKLIAADMSRTENSEAAWAPWGPWGGVDFVEPAPVFRR